MKHPHAYPNGWYHVADSSELKRGRSMAVSFCGEQIALLRSDVTGEVAALDGHCGHMGAALGGGEVKDGCVVCPFHGWRYDPKGRVAHIPYCEPVPPKLPALTTWPVHELDGQIFVWHAVHGEHRAPTYSLDADPRITNGELAFRGSHDGGTVSMTVLDFAENAADTVHFDAVHARMQIPWTQIPIPGVGTVVRPSWHLDEHRSHVMWLHTWGTLSILGRAIEGAAGTARVEFIGPGSLARFHFEIQKVGRVVVYQTHTPVGERAVRMRLRWYAEPRVPRVLVWYIVGIWASQWRQDALIWANRKGPHTPMLVEGDGPIHELRRWFGQFYGVHRRK